MSYQEQAGNKAGMVVREILAARDQGCVPVEKEPPIAEEFHALNRRIEEQKRIVDELYKKLNSVLPDVPEPSLPDVPSPVSGSSPLAHAIAEQARKIEHTNALLANLVNRVEV